MIRRCYRLPFACLALALGATAPTAPAAELVTRGGYSRNMVRNANENDMRSALLAYSRIISGANHLATASEQKIYESATDMAQSLRAAEVDIVVGPADEILALPPELVEAPYVISTVGGSLGVEYLLLVRESGPFHYPADLVGHHLNILDSANGLLASIWLDVVLAGHHLPRARQALAEIKPCAKPTLTALPVYFGQVDACVITRSAYATLCELNPQLRRGFRIIAESPRYHPLLAVFRRGIAPELKTAIRTAISTIDTTVAGRQLLTLFQIDGMTFCDESVLQTTVDLLAQHHQLPALPSIPLATVNPP